MKAVFNGIEMEGTPEELAKVLELIGKIEKEYVIKHEYHFPQYPQAIDQYWYGTKITCDSGSLE